MITDILSSGPRSPCSSPASSSEGPRDLSLHCRGEDSDGHESGTDSGLPGETSSVCSNGESVHSVWHRAKSRPQPTGRRKASVASNTVPSLIHGLKQGAKPRT